MITNEREYRITAAAAEQFDRALAHADEQATDLHPRLRQAMREGIESQLGELREQLAAYDALRGRKIAFVMYKRDLVEEVARKSNLSSQQARIVVDATLVAIRDALARGESVTLAGFGSFEVAPGEQSNRASRTGRHVGAHERKTPRFQADPELRRAVGAG